MASTEATHTPELEKIEHPPEAPPPEPKKEAPPRETPPPEAAEPAEGTPKDYFVVADVVLRFLLFASALTAVVVMVTSNETELVQIPMPPFRARLPAKFNHSPAFIYFVAALSVAGLYSIITTTLSLLAILKPSCYAKLLPHFVIFDVLLLGIVAAATGAAGGVAYIGLRGNSHYGWQKVCDDYDKFCQQLGGSIAVSLFASIVLILLIFLSIYTILRKIPK